GEKTPEALPVGDHLDQLDDAVGVVEAERHAARVLEREDALLEALHGPRERAAERDGVHREVVAHLVRLADRDEVVETQVDAERRKRLVLRTAVARIDAVAAERVERHLRAPLVAVLCSCARALSLLLDVYALLAAHRAGVAGAHLHAHLITPRDRVYLRDRVGGAQAIVENGAAALAALSL